TSKLNLSATSLAAVGSSISLTVAMTPSSSSALMTSPDFRRIFSASSPTVTDSGTRISSRLTSTGGSGGASTTAAGAGTPGRAAGARGTGGGAATRSGRAFCAGAAGGAGGAVVAAGFTGISGGSAANTTGTGSGTI